MPLGAGNIGPLGEQIQGPRYLDHNERQDTDSRVCTKKGLSQKEGFFVYSEAPKILKPT